MKVTCQSRTVDAKNPMSRPLQPPIRKHVTASVHGPIQSCLSMKRSSGYAREVADLVAVGLVVLVAEDPADVTPPEPALGGVDVALGVGEPVMVAMMRRPPERALLRRHRAAEREHELRQARESVRLVREVTVVPGGDEEHPRRERHDEQDHRGAGDAGEDREEREQVQREERERRPDVDLVVGSAVESRGLAAGGRARRRLSFGDL